MFNEQAGEPEFAAALDGTSPYDVRAPVLDRFKRGEIQGLVNCSLFTEGFDVPQSALVAIARPVLSRSFYAQMVGRGTRLSEGKRDLLVLDFVPINCRHSLAHAVDIFTSVDEEVREQARAVTKAASEEGEALALERVLELAQQAQEAREATVSYQLRERDPFQAVGIDVDFYVRRSRGGARATDKQRSYLEKAGLPKERAEQLSSRQAEAIQERLRERKAVGLYAHGQKVCAASTRPRCTARRPSSCCASTARSVGQAELCSARADNGASSATLPRYSTAELLGTGASRCACPSTRSCCAV